MFLWYLDLNVGAYVVPQEYVIVSPTCRSTFFYSCHLKVKKNLMKYWKPLQGSTERATAFLFESFCLVVLDVWTNPSGSVCLLGERGCSKGAGQRERPPGERKVGPAAADQGSHGAHGDAAVPAWSQGEPHQGAGGWTCHGERERQMRELDRQVVSQHRITGFL